MWWQDPRHLFPEVLEALDEGVMVIDHERIVRVFNRAAARLTGCSVEQALGRPCVEVIRSSDCPLCPLLRIFAGAEVPSQEFRITLSHFEPERVLAVHPVALRGEGGEAIGIMAIMRQVPAAVPLGDCYGERLQFMGLVGRSKPMQDIYRLIELAAASDAPVLVRGETGTGKELVATAIHHAGPRADRPLVKVNCSALPETLLEVELFGSTRSTKHDKSSDRPGRLGLADGGTLFLDEVADLSLRIQRSLLQALDSRQFHPVGATTSVPLAARVIAATHRNLSALVEQGKFLRDLYHRLDMIPLWIPPLRERKEDLYLLIETILEWAQEERRGRPCPTLEEAALDLLLAYDWPGNVRELQNVLRYAVLVCPSDRIGVAHLPYYVRQSVARSSFIREKVDLLQALERNRWHVGEAATDLGMHRTTLWRKMRRYGIERPL